MSVEPLHFVGRGFPDWIIGTRGVNLLCELKNQDASLTPDQLVWHNTWRGQKAICSTFEDVVAMIDQHTLGVGRDKRPLDEYLSPAQQKELAGELSALFAQGHGTVAIRVKNGKARFLEVTSSHALSGGGLGQGQEAA